MKLAHLLAHASGHALSDCSFLGYRYDPTIGFVWDHLESWVVRRMGGGVLPLASQAGWLTDLWRSPAGTVYVSGAGAIHRLVPQEVAPGWTKHLDRLEGALSGVWGLDDGFVLAWGELGSRNVMYLWNGASWREIPSPGYVNGVHGTSRTLVYAVGANGLLARWSGAGWTRLPSQTDTMLSRVFVAGPDEMYAVGAGGRLLEGSVHGWSELAVAPGQLYDVARHAGKVWVAAGPDGLFALEGNALVAYSQKVTPERFDARGELLISAKTLLLQLEPDGSFLTGGLQGFVELTRNEAPRWLSQPA